MASRSRKKLRQRRHWRIRKRVAGTATVPRMSVYTSNQHLYVQFIDDDTGQTLAAVSTLDPQLRDNEVSDNVTGAETLGRMAAERAIAAGLKKVVFDRAGFKFHGRVKAIADQARKAGLEF